MKRTKDSIKRHGGAAAILDGAMYVLAFVAVFELRWPDFEVSAGYRATSSGNRQTVGVVLNLPAVTDQGLFGHHLGREATFLEETPQVG